MSSRASETGDAVLQRFADVLKARLRSSDIVCRYGGEEFVVLAYDATPQALEKLLTRLIDDCRATPLDTPAGPVEGFTFSAGIAACPTDSKNLQPLVQTADARLYGAKRRGRAQVSCATT